MRWHCFSLLCAPACEVVSSLLSPAHHTNSLEMIRNNWIWILLVCAKLLWTLDYEELYFAVHNSGLETMGETMCQCLKLMYWWGGCSAVWAYFFILVLLYWMSCHLAQHFLNDRPDLLNNFMSVFKRHILCILPTWKIIPTEWYNQRQY